MNITKLSKDYAIVLKKHYAEQKIIENKIKSYENKIEKLREQKNKDYVDFPNWTESIIRPIINEVARKTNTTHDNKERLVPMGLNAEVSVFFKSNGSTKYSLHFVPDDLENGTICLRNHAIDTKRYKYGTIGEMNGDNHPREPMPKTIEGIIKIMKKHNRQEMKQHLMDIKNNLYSFEKSSKILKETEKYRLSEVITPRWSNYENETMKRVELKINGEYVFIARYGINSYEDKTEKIIKAIETSGYYCERGMDDIEKQLAESELRPTTSIHKFTYSKNVYVLSGDYEKYTSHFEYIIWDKEMIKKVRKLLAQKLKVKPIVAVA